MLSAAFSPDGLRLATANMMGEVRVWDLAERWYPEVEALPLKQEDVKRDGWAIECRINAEDPFRNFLPSTGRLVRFVPPATTMFAGDTERLDGVRVDTGVMDGGEIPMFYDSMIAKLIVHGRDRNEAIAKMREALNQFVIRGVASNIA